MEKLIPTPRQAGKNWTAIQSCCQAAGHGSKQASWLHTHTETPMKHKLWWKKKMSSSKPLPNPLLSRTMSKKQEVGGERIVEWFSGAALHHPSSLFPHMLALKGSCRIASAKGSSKVIWTGWKAHCGKRVQAAPPPPSGVARRGQNSKSHMAPNWAMWAAPPFSCLSQLGQWNNVKKKKKPLCFYCSNWLLWQGGRAAYMAQSGTVKDLRFHTLLSTPLPSPALKERVWRQGSFPCGSFAFILQTAKAIWKAL